MLLNIEFTKQYYFLLFLFLPIVLYFFYKKETLGINFLFLDDIKKVYKKNSYTFYFKFILLISIYSTFVILLADPNKINTKENIEKNGIDIVITFDVSVSMETQDLKPNRMVLAKEVINKFIGSIKTHRVGLVIFAGKPFTSIPLTFDYKILSESISNISTKTINQERGKLSGTAIGDALLMSKNLFKSPKNMSDEEYKKRKKVIILITDGEANIGINPIYASLIAKESNIIIHTIGIGSDKGGSVVVDIGNGIKTEIQIPPLNDKSLKEISKNTFGTYFRASDNETFKNIFNQLEKLEKNDIKIEITKVYSPYYQVFVIIFLLSLFLFILIL